MRASFIALLSNLAIASFVIVKNFLTKNKHPLEKQYVKGIIIAASIFLFSYLVS